MYVISSSTMIMAGRKKAAPRNTRSTGMPVTELRTKTTPPIGGVSRPIIRLKMMIDPSWIGSTPNSTAIGSRIGVMISSADVGSRIMPQMIRSTFTRSRKTSRVVREGEQRLGDGLGHLLPRQDPAEQRRGTDDDHDLAADDGRVAKDERDV